MSQTNANQNSLSVPLIVIVACIAGLIAVVSSNAKVRSAFAPQNEQRKILAKVFTEFNNQVYIVFKVQTERGIDLEIFEKDISTQSQKFKQKFSLEAESEAFLMINSNSVNLAMIDVNKDNSLDIISPTVDKLGNSRLNVIEYNSELNQFVPMAQSAL